VKTLIRLFLAIGAVFWVGAAMAAETRVIINLSHPKAGQVVRDRPRRLVRIVRWLCAVLILQLSIGFAVAQQNVAEPQQQVQKEPRDLLKEEITASENQTAKQSPESLSDGGLWETPKMALMRTWITKQSNDLLDIIKVLYKGRDAELKELETAQAKMNLEDQIEHRIVLIKETLLQKEAK
jgi:hypothetical protein